MSLAAIDKSQPKFGPHGKRSLNSYKSARESFPDAYKTLTEAHKKLGVESLLVLPTASAHSPAWHETGIGHYPDLADSALIKVLQFMGVKKVADLPISYLPAAGLKNGDGICPYAGDSSMLATHLIDWKALPEAIQPTKSFNEVFRSTPGEARGSSYISYEHIGEHLPALTAEAYSKFQNIQALPPEELRTFVEGYNKFIADRGKIIKANILAEYIAVELPNEGSEKRDDYSTWSKEHKNLFLSNESIEGAINKYGLTDKIEEASLAQFIAFHQLQDRNTKLQEAGIGVIGDVPIGLPKIYELICPSAILPGFCMGAPKEGRYGNFQKWDFLVLDPRKFINPDDSYGEAGQVLRDHIKWLGSLFGGKLRIDHGISVLGGGWIYPKDSDPDDLNAFRLRFAPPDHPLDLARDLSLIKDSNAFNQVEFGYHPDATKREYLDQHPEIIDQAAEWLSRIVLPTLKNVASELRTEAKIVIENLGVLPLPVRMAYEKLARENSEVSQMFVFQHIDVDDSNNEHRPTSAQIQPGDVFFTSTHDSKQSWSYVQEIYKKGEQQPWIEYFQSLFPNLNADELKNDPRKFLEYYTAASRLRRPNFLEEATTSVGAFFTDLFGPIINKNGQQIEYNEPGTSAATSADGKDPNWRTRVVSIWVSAWEKAMRTGIVVSPYKAAALGIEAKYTGEDYTQDIQQLVTSLREIDAELKREVEG